MLHGEQRHHSRFATIKSIIGMFANKTADFLRPSVTARCIFALLLASVLNISYLIWKLIILATPVLHEFVDIDFLKQEVLVGLGLSGVYLLGILMIWCLRGYPKIHAVLEFFCLQVIALSMAYQGYAFGSVSVVTGMMLMCMSTIGLVLFSRIALYSAVFTGLTALAGTAYAYSAGLLPYAPKFISPDMYASSADSFFLISNNFLFSAPIFLGGLLALDFLKTELKNRELLFSALLRLDPLTQVYNRHMIYEYMHAASIVQGTSTLSQQDAIILLDMDLFKAINDQYGHQVGDQLLIQAAKTLRQHVREQDILARFGGEEFIIILPEASIATAHRVAERCRHAIAAMQISLADEVLRCTASFGLTLSTDRQHLDRQIDAADQALYQAKRQGRNCTVVYPSELLVEEL